MRIIYKIFLFLVLLFPAFSYAAYIKFEPEFPSPNEKVKASLILDEKNYNAQITWFVDDKIVAEDKSFIEIEAPDYAKTKEIKALIKYTNKSPEFISKTLKSIILDLIYEANTYSHPLVPVSPYNTVGSSFTIYANAKIPNYDSKKLIYIWKKDGRRIDEISGQGKNVAKIDMDYFAADHYIELELKDPDTLSTLAKKGVYIVAYKPQIFVYLKDPLIGFKFNRVLEKSLVLQGQKELLAIPFSMSAKYLFDPNIKWQWYVDNKKIEENEASTPYVSVYFKDKEKDKVNLKVIASYMKHILQQASYTLNILKKSAESKVKYTNPAEGTEDSTSGFGI